MVKRATFAALALLFLAWAFLGGGLAAADEGEPLTLTSGLLHVYHSGHDHDLAERSLTILEDALERYSEHLNAGDEPIRIIIAASHGEFARFAGVHARTQVGGIAFSEQGVVVVKAPPLLLDRGRYGDILRHELVHVMLARTVDLNNLPRWLNEGVAMTLAGEYQWRSRLHIARMYSEGRILSYRDLTVVFAMADSKQFGDIYAQSHSMTRHLQGVMGAAFWDMIRDLEDKPFHEALDLHTGLTPAEMWEQWHGSLWQVALITSIVSGFTLFQFMALLCVWAYVRKRRQGQALMREWEDEEREAAMEGPLPLSWDEAAESWRLSWDDEDEEEWR